MSSRAIQCRGKEKVLELYDNRKAEAWSIWQGSQFLFRGIGGDSLDAMLEAISSGGNAIYTLKVYDDIKDEKNIKAKTAEDGSFNFRLHPEGVPTPEGQMYLERKSYMQEQIDALKKQNELLLEKFTAAETEDEDDEEKDNSINGIIGSIIENPEKAKPFIDLFHQIKGLFAGPGPQYPQQRQIASVGNVMQYTQQPQAMETKQSEVKQSDIFTNEESMTRLYNAVEKIAKVDPDVLDHLEKLADMAEKKPNKFLGILNWL